MANTLDHGGNVNDVWSKIWSMKIPSNIRNFLWRCMQSVLPTMSALHSRGVSVDTACPLCRQEPETLQHLMFECSQVALLWTDATHLLDASLPFASWIESVITTGPGTLVLRCVANCWGIWRGRNDQIWNSKPWQVSRIQTEINQLLISWQQVMSEAPSVVGQSMPHGETVTVGEGILKVFVDAAVFPNSDHAYYRIVVTDGGGDFVAAKNGSLRCHKDVHLAALFVIRNFLIRPLNHTNTSKTVRYIILFPPDSFESNPPKPSLPLNFFNDLMNMPSKNVMPYDPLDDIPA
nr:uncharacterized protein LOC109146988 [Ipomoea batatas]